MVLERTISSARLSSSLLVLLAAMMVGGYGVRAQEINDQIRLQDFSIEANANPGSLITWRAPSTTITPYKLYWPSGGPIQGATLVAVRVAVDTFQMEWAFSSGNILELVSSANLNVRRVNTAVEGGIVGTPGYVSNDFQGSRTSSGQTATAGMAIVFGGAQNAVSGYEGTVAGGLSNAVSATQGNIVGGDDNAVSGYRGGILAGTDNSVSANQATLLGGDDNAVSGNMGFLGAGTNNAVSGNQSTSGGGNNNSVSSNMGVILGGIGNAASGNQATVLSGNDNAVSSDRGAIGGGSLNSISGAMGVLGAGYHNSVSGSNGSVMLGGAENTMSGQYSVLLGGYDNNISPNLGFIGGGQNNSINGGLPSNIVGGRDNNNSANYNIILGGANHQISSQYNTLGGRAITISGQNNFMFNALNRAMSLSTSNIALLANLDVWIADNDNSVHDVRFYEAYNTSGSYPGANTNYVGFRAPTSTYDNQSQTYTLPDRIVTTANSVVTIASSPTPTANAATLTWSQPAQYTVTTVNVTANNQAIAAASVNDDELLRLNTNGIALNRRVTLANGATSGFVLAIRCVGAAGNGITLLDADANLDLAGDAVLAPGDSIELVWDGTSNVWFETNRSDN
ncbi:MAG: hypothetical protein J5I53_04335 [Bradyrhizobiaceae bacterium]|nr:hypothetical protein [Bradyrhizobiaceae bacterium]